MTDQSKSADVAGQDEGLVREKVISWNAVLSTFLPAFVFALGTGIALPAVPGIAKSFHVGFGVATGVTSAFLIGNVVGALPSGWLVDRFGTRRMMLTGPFLTAAIAFLVVFASSFPQLLVYRFLDGCAAQIWVTGRLASISHNAAPDERGRYVSWLFGMDNAGRLVGPAAGGFIAVSFGLRAPFAAYAMLALLALVPTYFFAKDTPHHRHKEDEDKAPTMSLREMVMPRLAYFKVAFLASLTRGPNQAGLLYIYAAFAYPLNPKQIGFLIAAAAGTAVPITFLSGWMLDRFGRKRAMVPGFIGIAAVYIGFAIGAVNHIPFFWFAALLILGSAAQSFTGGSIQTIGADVAPDEARGKFLGIFRFTGQGGSALSPVIFPILAATLGHWSAFSFIALTAASVAYLLIRRIPETSAAKI